MSARTHAQLPPRLRLKHTELFAFNSSPVAGLFLRRDRTSHYASQFSANQRCARDEDALPRCSRTRWRNQITGMWPVEQVVGQNTIEPVAVAKSKPCPQARRFRPALEERVFGEQVCRAALRNEAKGFTIAIARRLEASGE